MKDYNYNFEVQTLLTHFATAFNDVKIKRFDGNKYQKEVIKVPFVYAPKSHILADLLGLTDTVKLPIMAVEVKSQGRDNDRVKNKISDIVYKNDDGSYVNLQVVPWNISVELNILTKFQEDMDQIIQNFSINTDPYIIISWREPKSDRELRTEIMWDGQINYTYPGKDQGPKDHPFRVTASTNFTIKGYIFKTTVENSKPICKINTDYVFTDKFYCNYSEMLMYTTSAQTDSYTITGRPVLRYVSPHYLIEKQSPKITVKGYSLGSTESIYLSSSNPNMYPSTEYRPFTGLPSFFAFPVENFQKSDNVLSFTIPAPSAHGFVDIIAVNSCGYGKLTQDANRCGRMENPYPTTSPDHYNWVVKQFPYLNGLIVSNYFDPYLIDNTDVVYQYFDECPIN